MALLKHGKYEIDKQPLSVIALYPVFGGMPG